MAVLRQETKEALVGGVAATAAGAVVLQLVYVLITWLIDDLWLVFGLVSGLLAVAVVLFLWLGRTG